MATSGTCGDNLYWTLDEGGLLTVSGNGTVLVRSSDWTSSFASSVLALQLEAEYISEIQSDAFSGFSIHSLTYEFKGDCIIGQNAFKGCEYLETVYINARQIETSAFEGCSRLQTLELFGGSIEYVGQSAFKGCGLLSAVNIECSGDNTFEIMAHAFDGCTSLTGIGVPNLASIGEYAFKDCGLTSFTVGKSVSRVGSGAFEGCPLSKIDVTEGNTTFSSVDGVLYAKLSDGTRALSIYPSGKTSSTYTCPSDVSYIPPGTFAKNTHLSKVTFNGRLTSILARTFYGCTSLAYVALDNIRSIGSHAFYGCKSISSLTLPDCTTTVESNAFEGCTSMLNLAINGEGKSFGQYVFKGCTSITCVFLPVFTGGVKMFYSCTSLRSVFLEGDWTTFPDGMFMYCSSLTYFPFVDSVTSVSDEMFRGCTSLLEVHLGRRVGAVGGYAFAGCTSLARVEIPDCTTSIGACAFQGCSALTSVTIPSSVASIGYGAFQNCTSLARMLMKSFTPPVASGTPGVIAPSGTVMTVPYGSVPSYKSKYAWESFEYEENADIGLETYYDSADGWKTVDTYFMTSDGWKKASESHVRKASDVTEGKVIWVGSGR